MDDLFSAGPHVAFRVTCSVMCGLEDVERDRVGAPATLHLVGLVTVADGRVSGGRVVRDRLGLARSLALVTS